MDRAEALKELQSNEQQAKQFNMVAGENTSEKQLTEALDSLLGQINKDLEAQIIKKFEELKK